jgi:hypothetical protein
MGMVPPDDEIVSENLLSTAYHTLWQDARQHSSKNTWNFMLAYPMNPSYTVAIKPRRYNAWLVVI